MANYKPPLVGYARKVEGVLGKQAQIATIGLMLAIAATCSWAQSCENLQTAIDECKRRPSAVVDADVMVMRRR